MKFIPAMSILHGKVAVVENGRYEYLRDPEGGFSRPAALASDIAGDIIFILDIDGIERNSPNLETVKMMAAHKEVWLDAGTGNVDDMMDVFVNDASEVVMGTKSLESLEQLREAAELSDKIIFALDYNDGIISLDKDMAAMDVAGLVEAVKDFKGLDTAILMDLGSHMSKSPVNPNHVDIMAGAFPNLYVCSHVSRDELGPLEEHGVKGIIADFRALEELK